MALKNGYTELDLEDLVKVIADLLIQVFIVALVGVCESQDKRVNELLQRVVLQMCRLLQYLLWRRQEFLGFSISLFILLFLIKSLFPGLLFLLQSGYLEFRLVLQEHS